MGTELNQDNYVNIFHLISKVIASVQANWIILRGVHTETLQLLMQVLMKNQRDDFLVDEGNFFRNK